MRFLLIFILVPLSYLAGAQTKDDARESFDEGEYFFAREEYTEAAWFFRKLIQSDTGNSHYNFKLGECYMNIPGLEQLAVPYFEKATKNIVTKKLYRSHDFFETNAPLHAWFYLGNAYRIAGRLNDALHAYDFFINSPLYYGNYNINVVENEVKSCERAKIIMDSPVTATIEPLDSSINTAASELYPVISSDEQTMVFVRKLKFYDAILCITRQGATWSQPINLNPIIGSDGEYYPVSLSHDGHALYLMKIATDSKDLYVTYQRNGSWTKAESLGNSVNSMADETWASVSEDGQTLWFTSSRKGGLGGLDIYYARMDKNNHWNKVKNAGKVINTAFDEESPFLTNHDGVLYFSSRGHYSMGGYDIFYAEKEGKTWKTPVNIGFPINNTGDNTGFVPTQGGRSGYYSFINLADAASSEDVYHVVFK